MVEKYFALKYYFTIIAFVGLFGSVIVYGIYLLVMELIEKLKEE